MRKREHSFHGSIAGKNIVCNGFYREKTTFYLELMKASGRISFTDPNTLHPAEEITIPCKGNAKTGKKIRVKKHDNKGNMDKVRGARTLIYY